MKDNKLKIEVNTNIKRDYITFATTEDIFKALKRVIDIPDNVIRLELSLSVDKPPEITFMKIAETPKE